MMLKTMANTPSDAGGGGQEANGAHDGSDGGSGWEAQLFSAVFLLLYNQRAWLHRGAKERVEERLSRRASLGFGSAAGGRPVSSVGGPPAWGLGR
ncbi:hypothetical protein D5086_028191 [Populus alba]|uniref:Uncharacterized protein n=1 Tax=Populus alba TaxID=43335 RepID=A0ACC4AXG5_POPAL